MKNKKGKANDVMKKKADLKSMYGLIKEMYESGSEVKEIVCELGISKDSIYRALAKMNVKIRLERRRKYEDERLVYAVHEEPVLEKIVIDGKRYIDITPLFSPK